MKIFYNIEDVTVLFVRKAISINKLNYLWLSLFSISRYPTGFGPCKISKFLLIVDTTDQSFGSGSDQKKLDPNGLRKIYMNVDAAGLNT